ncbi:MAG TPA: helix-turn-helix transcriptional regulator [Pseudonocardia sp.]|uniref:helix-turn-helix domain-containing protein n=1 Tax=Pseudonocardia sp. TaxID=60912 RepID=UPI002B7C9E45|nr:helix-turn-helix transcriptional regulator [Pseudonocardia sp.]HTF49503.1 helix-turn-helix transcriptional regulator [Pseudonocardia sp.]
MSAPRPRPGASLTVRQVEILSMVARGMTNERIAQRLGLNLDSVKRAVRDLRIKLGAQDRASAVDQGWRQGYLGMWRVGVDYTTRRNGHLVSGVRDSVQS